ncbi:hypothetical protein ANCDUO_13997 [Ancylostoma duodenale]|uniref:BOS complex subunit TMEM147 n=1 Tax=Ancylostoma duodenale TaxID=51022 RepID=A0A0C2GFC3_9BILA|nr:hypothetical protein ANCDUO_13997 [Ancylostoma duodenale]
MHIVMTHLLNGKREVQFLAGGLGWGAAHSVASSFILFWVGARASAFSWRWMQMAMDSSFDLILLFVAMAALTWMATRAASRHLVFVFLTACVLHSFVYHMDTGIGLIPQAAVDEYVIPDRSLVGPGDDEKKDERSPGQKKFEQVLNKMDKEDAYSWVSLGNKISTSF